MSTRGVFIDRDGTLIEETGYLNDLSRLKLFPYTVDAVRQLNRAGFVVVVVTNQAGIARGIVPEAFVETAHAHISRVLQAGGARIDRYYHCPHHPDGIVQGLNRTCDCRKPAPGLWRQAARELSIDLTQSFTIGDRWLDVRAGRAAGVTSGPRSRERLSTILSRRYRWGRSTGAAGQARKGRTAGSARQGSAAGCVGAACPTRRLVDIVPC